ncbi:MAG: hypothetical protein ACK4UN_18975 [Limisphaerales bacterium]
MIWSKLKEPPWRTIVPGCGFLILLFVAFSIWSPGKDIRDGRHDLGQNGIWLGHGWLGGDEWFTKHNKTDQITRFRELSNIQALANNLRLHRITDVFPHLCPATIEGELPPVDADQVERFLDVLSEFRVMPWIGGVNGENALYENARWRSNFVSNVRKLFQQHPRFAGVQINVEPLTNGDEAFLAFLDQLRTAIPPGKILSIAAYPPPTRWHPYPEVHWDEPYFREVAKRTDQLAVMMYDTSLRVPKLYQKLMADWTREVLAWSEGRPVLLGVPTYDDGDAEYHHPEVENLRNALLGIHRGLSRKELPSNYQGVVIYCEWETDETEWKEFRNQFLKSP